jgi:hypothetical protein
VTFSEEDSVKRRLDTQKVDAFEVPRKQIELKNSSFEGQ